MTPTAVRERLQPFASELMRWSYSAILERCRRQGLPVVWVWIPVTDDPPQTDDLRFGELGGMAREAGFSVLRLKDVFGNHDRQTLQLAPWDPHPNVLGHRLLAEGLHAELRRHPSLLGLEPQPVEPQRAQDASPLTLSRDASPAARTASD